MPAHARKRLSYEEWSRGLISIIKKSGDADAAAALLVSKESALTSLAFTAPEMILERESVYKERLFNMVKVLEPTPGVRAALSLYFTSFT